MRAGQERQRPEGFRWRCVCRKTVLIPAQISDLYSNYVIANIIEPPCSTTILARPTILKPRTAAPMPEILVRFPHVTVRILGHLFRGRPGVQGEPGAN